MQIRNETELNAFSKRLGTVKSKITIAYQDFLKPYTEGFWNNVAMVFGGPTSPTHPDELQPLLRTIKQIDSELPRTISLSPEVGDFFVRKLKEYRTEYVRIEDSHKTGGKIVNAALNAGAGALTGSPHSWAMSIINLGDAIWTMGKEADALATLRTQYPLVLLHDYQLTKTNKGYELQRGKYEIQGHSRLVGGSGNSTTEYGIYRTEIGISKSIEVLVGQGHSGAGSDRGGWNR